MTDLWQPLWLSLRIAVSATILAAVFAIPLAYVLARKKFTGKSLVEGLILMPLVLPPTVVGYLILVTLGRQGVIGKALFDAFEYSVIFRIEAAILAAAIVAFPLLYLPAKSAFASVEREMEDIARLYGANRLQLFWHVSAPLARRGLTSGTLLAFARALGEFGATVMVFGWQPGKLTLPISIYADYEQPNLPHATPAVIALSLLSLALVMAYNASAAGKQE